MPMNNRLVNSCIMVIDDDDIKALIVNLKDRSIISTDVIHPLSMSRDAITESIFEFITQKGVDDGINIHIAVNYPSRNGVVYGNSDLESLQKWFYMKYGRTIHVQSIADLLAYRTWNMNGYAMKTMTAKRKWLSNSRIALCYITKSKVSLSMIDSGKIIDGLGLNQDLYCVGHAGIDNSNDVLLYKAILDELAENVDNLLHPSSIYYYFNTPLPYGLSSSSYKVFDKHDNTIDDIAESIIMIEGGFNAEPDYIIQEKSNYDDIYIPIEDENGKVRNVPLFQH